MIFYIKNWLWKSNFGTSDSSPSIQNSKFNHFLLLSWFLGKNLSNFVFPIWKLHNPYCHSHHAWSRHVDTLMWVLNYFDILTVIYLFQIQFSIARLTAACPRSPPRRRCPGTPCSSAPTGSCIGPGPTCQRPWSPHFCLQMLFDFF